MGPQLNVENPTPHIDFFGGGGVGVQANPVIGNDGSLMAVDVVEGGYGYQYPPHVKARDDLNIGSGTVLTAKLGTKAKTYIVYDKEEDYEEYDLTSCRGVDLNDYGTRRNIHGKPVGIWDPTIYANLSKDPIRAEIYEYQKYLARGLNPWWTTRKQIPLSITSDVGTKRIKYDVRHWQFGGSRSGGVTTGGDPLEFVETEFLVYTQGDVAGKGLMFKFTEKSGGHKFTIKADSYRDGAQAESVKIKVKPNSTYNVVSAGSHKKGRGTEQGLITAGSFGGRGKEQDDAGGGPTSTSIFADMVGTADDDDDLQIQSKSGVFKQGKKGRSSDGKHDTFELTYILEDSNAVTPVTTTAVKTTIDDSFMNTYAISPVPPSNVPGSDYAGTMFTFVWEEDFPYDGEYIFRSARLDEAHLYVDNVFVMDMEHFRGRQAVGTDTGKALKKTMTAGVHQIRVDLLNNPIIENIISQPAGTNDVTFKITTAAEYGNGVMIHGLGIDVKKEYEGAQINETFIKTVEPGKLYDVILISPETESKHGGLRIRTQGNNVLQAEEAKDNDWKDIEVNASQGKFINLSQGNSKEARCQFVLTDVPPPQVIDSSTKVTDGILVEDIFNTVDWMGRANRQLWRTNVYGRGGFLGKYGVCPFDTIKSLKDNPYAGTHRIIWNDVKFPFEGNYTIEVEVDDNVNLQFKRAGRIEVDIRKEGFVNKLDSGWPDNSKPGNHGTGKSTYVRTFKAGTYQIIADLEQIPDGAFGFGGQGDDVSIAIPLQAKFIKKLEDNKLLTIRAAENVVRILPPLNVKKSEIDLAIKIVRKVCKEFNVK